MFKTQVTNLSEDEILIHLSLGRITFLNFWEKNILFKKLDSSNTLAIHSIEDIENLVGRKLSKRVIWDGKENLRMAKLALNYCRQLNIQIIVNFQSDYPEILRQIADPPYLLFCRGDVSLLKGRNISVVGTRRLSPAGKTAARQFAYNAVVDGKNIVSGLANGADGFAHQGAIDAYFDYLEKGIDASKLGKTIAVIPSSIDEIVPGTHKKMAAQILQSGGLIISEYEPKMGMATWHFVGRNRIIAGLSSATLVVEAPAGSGALITADFALENGRDVFFHEAAFGENAEQISALVKNELQAEHALGKVSKYKMENTPEKYLEAGAPVIKDYKDFCKALTELPGERSMPDIPVQGTLFD